MDGFGLLALIQARALTSALLRAGVLTSAQVTGAIAQATAELVVDERMRAEICFALDDAAHLH